MDDINEKIAEAVNKLSDDDKVRLLCFIMGYSLAVKAKEGGQ